jgi:hypothetical protein
MRIVTNDKKIELRKKIGERAPFVGLIILVASTVILFAKPEWMGISMVIVWIGLLISLTGSYLGDRYVGPYAPHKKLPEALKGMSDDYVLLLYQTRTPFVLLEPGCLTVMTVKSQPGTVTYQDGVWKHQLKWGFVRRFAGQESVGRPDRLSNAEVGVLQAYLEKQLPEDITVPVRGIVIFTHPDVHLEAEHPSVPALRAAELKRWLRRNPQYPKLSPETRNAVLSVFNAEEDQVNSTA